MPDEIEWTDEDEEAATRAWAQVTGRTTPSGDDDAGEDEESAGD